jgi:hypothetical protein
MSLLVCFTCVSLLDHLNIYLQWIYVYIFVYAIYEFVYIFVYLELSNKEIKAKKKKTGMPYADDIAVGIALTIWSRVPSMPRVWPSAYATPTLRVWPSEYYLARAAARLPSDRHVPPLHRGRGYRRSSGHRLDLTWAHSATPRASSTPMANTFPPRAVYTDEQSRGLPSV